MIRQASKDKQHSWQGELYKMKKILVVLADGAEEVEALTPVDYLRRAGVDVTVAGVAGDVVEGSHGIKIIADCTLDSLGKDGAQIAQQFDGIFVPGGMQGTKNCSANNLVIETIIAMHASGKLVSAICAAPVVVLAKTGVLKNCKYTCYPGMEQALEEYCGSNYPACTSGAQFVEDRVVQSGNVITSRGAGTAEEFAFALVEYLCGAQKRLELSNSVVAR